MQSVGIEVQLRQLRAAAAQGPFAEDHFNQVAGILNQDKCALKYCTVAIHIVTLSLRSHPPADPSAPLPSLLPSGLLPAIFSLCQRNPTSPPIAGLTLSQTLFTEATASMFDALLQPPLNAVLDIQQRGGTPAESSRQIQAWRPLLRQLNDIHTNPTKSKMRKWIEEAAVSLPEAPFVERYRKEWATICADVLQEDIGQPTNRCHQLALPGTLLGVGSAAMLGEALTSGQRFLDGDRPTWLSHDPVKSLNSHVDGSRDFMRKFVAVLEQDAAAFPLPHGMWPRRVAEHAEGLTADFCHVLLGSPKALGNLATPLVALAVDVSLWQTGAHTHHMQLLDDLCRWVGSINGTAAVQKLAQQLVQPVTAALDTLLEQLGPDDRKGAAYLVQTTIRVMTHLAATDHGRSHMASSGCLPRWLELAPRWRRQPGVLQRLLLLATAPFVPVVDGIHTIWTGRLLKYLQYEGGKQGLLVLPEFTCGACPNLLHLQVASSRSIDALAALMEGELDPISWCFVARLLQEIQESNPAALKPLMPALLAFARPKTPLLAYPAKPGSDLKRYLSHCGVFGGVTLANSCSHQEDQLSALNIVCCHINQANPADSAGSAQAIASAAGMSVKSHLAEWLDVLQQDGRAEAAGGLACSEVARMVHDLLCCGLGGPVVMTAFGMGRNVVPHLASLLPHAANLGPNDNGVVSVALAAAFGVAVLNAAMAADEDALPWQYIRGCSYFADLPARLAKGPTLAAMLQHLQRWAAELGAASGSGWPAAAMVQNTMAAQTLSMLSIVACCWGSRGQEGQACRMVLEAKVPVWGLFKHGLAAHWVASFIDPCLHFLYQQLQQEEQPELQRLAKEVLVEQLGEKVVGAALRRAELLESWKQYEKRFAEVFKEAACKARPAARPDRGAADRNNQHDQKATSSRKSCSSSGLGNKAASSSAARSVGTAGSAGTSSAAGQSASISAGAVASSLGSQPGARKCCCHCNATPEVSFLCSRCQVARYCSKECQKADWKQHKLACKQQP